MEIEKNYTANLSNISSLGNHFLIAMPRLKDPIFSRSVTYICDHSDQGAMGIVINQPMEITLFDVFDQLEIEHQAEDSKTAVLAGGPVNVQRGFVLHRDQGSWDSTLHITSEICLTASRDIVTALANGNGPKSAQFALGYAGWSPGQLENEIKENSWLVIPADTGIIFDTPVEERWASAAKHIGIDLDLISATSGHA